MKPLVNWFKIITDGAFNLEHKLGGAGVVLRDCNGKMIWAAAQPLQAPNVFVAECTAVRLGLFIASTLNFKNIVLEMDSQAV